MTNSKVKAYAALLLAFSLGTVAGASITYARARQESADREGRSDRKLRALAGALSLNEQQKSQISAIWERNRDERRRTLQEAVERCGERARAHKARVDDEIRAVLTPEQRARFDELQRSQPEPAPSPLFCL